MGREESDTSVLQREIYSIRGKERLNFQRLQSRITSCGVTRSIFDATSCDACAQ